MNTPSDHYDKLMAQGKRAEADAFADAHPTDEHWPTQEQFDAASAQGAEYAMEEHRNGATQGQESPLSGEWADGMTARKVAFNVGYVMADHEEDYESAEDELADAWERGYRDAWAHSIETTA